MILKKLKYFFKIRVKTLDNYKRNQAELPVVPEIQQFLDVENDLIIKPNSLIILTPKPLQKILEEEN